MNKLPITLTQLLILTVFRIVYAGRVKTTVVGDSIPTGPVVIAANHVKMLDPFIIACFLPLLTIFRVFPYKFMTASGIYHQIWKPLAWLAGCFPAKPRKTAEPATSYGVGASIQAIQQHYSLVMFPEGKRTAKPIEAKYGIVRILQQTNAPLVLCRISWSKKGLLRFPRLVVRQAPHELSRRQPSEIMQAVYKLQSK